MIVFRGGGDIATGSIHRLYECGYHLLILEHTQPSAIRRRVAFSDAVYHGTAQVEGVTARLVTSMNEIRQCWENNEIPLMTDPEAKMIEQCRPDVVIDAILAKKNLGTTIDMAPLTIALGPGFSAGEDVDYVVETKRGHKLARIIEKGTAIPNTGIPGNIGGFSKERVIHSPAEGVIHNLADISDIVEKGQVIAEIEGTPVIASLTGVLRGLIADGFYVKKGLKIADIDPRMQEKENCDTISDKARCIGGSVLEIVLKNGYLPDEPGFGRKTEYL